MKPFAPRKIDNFRQTFTNLSYKFPKSMPKWGARDLFMIWEHTYTSRTSGRQYTICLNYEKWFAPKVWIVDPNLHQYDGYLPHVYKKESNRLCLYHPRDFQWRQDKDLINTVILWTMLWIEFFDIYIETKIWHGPKAEHDLPTQSPKQDNEMNEQPIVNKTKLSEPKYLQPYPIRLSST